MESPGERYNLLVSDRCSPSTVKSKLYVVLFGDKFYFFPDNGARMLALGFSAEMVSTEKEPKVTYKPTFRTLESSLSRYREGSLEKKITTDRVGVKSPTGGSL